MRRIISGKTKESIRKYILKNITLTDYGADESLMTDSEKLLRTYSIFKDEKQWESIHFGDPPAFRHWLRGTPRAMAIAISYHDQRKIIGSWLEEAPEEIEQYALRSQTIERVFADAKEKHAMRYTPYRGLAAVTAWVKLKFAAMNLKKLALHKWRLFLLFYLHLLQEATSLRCKVASLTA